MHAWISLTTDYGVSDGFVAVLHGVLARIAPDARVIDVTHDVPPGDVARGAAVLAQTVAALPVGIHVAVVDPGVGTARRAIAVRTPHGILVGPDNGLLLPAADALGGPEAAIELTNASWHAPSPSATFHGRDIFAPVAARLAAGAAFADAGTQINTLSLVHLPAAHIVVGDGFVEADVLTVDHFGNVQLAAPATVALGTGSVLVNGIDAHYGTTFGQVAPGSLVVFGDSAGHLAIAVNRGRATDVLHVSPGDRVRIDRV